MAKCKALTGLAMKGLMVTCKVSEMYHTVHISTCVSHYMKSEVTEFGAIE